LRKQNDANNVSEDYTTNNDQTRASIDVIREDHHVIPKGKSMLPDIIMK